MRSIKNLAIVFIVLFSFGVEAQNSGLQWDGLDTTSNRLSGKIMGRIYYITAMANSHFLFPKEWVDGEIVLSDGDKYEGMKLRYLASEDELIAYNNNNSNLFYVDKDQIKSFVLVDDEIHRKFERLYPKGENKKGRFYEMLYEGKQSLLAKRYIYERKVNPFVDEFGIMRDIEYEFRSNHFRYLEDKSITKISISRRGVIHAFPEHKKQIKKILRTYRITVNNEESMAILFQHLEEQGIF